jgi:hypothetical protein
MRMFFSTHSFAVVLCLTLLAQYAPTVSSQATLPPSLSAEKLRLVRANAIHSSTRRSVCLRLILIAPGSLSYWQTTE